MGLFDWARRPKPSRDAVGLPSPPPMAPAVDADPVKRGIAALEAGQFAAACDAFREAVKREPGSAANHVNLAYALQQAGADALPSLHQAVALDADSFDARYMLGGALEQAGDPAGAAGHLTRAVALRPDFAPAHADLCRALAASGETAAARAAIDAALALHPDHADLHHYLGNLCMAESDPAAAVVSYERALALQPASVRVHNNLGLALHAQKRFDEAAASFERALAIDPLAADSHAKLGAARKAQRRFEDAAVALRHALEIRPDDADSLNNLGIVLQERGLLAPAIESYRRAIALCPDQPGGYANLGLALYEQGDVAQAVTTYRQGLAIRPVAEMHDNLAIALQKQGRVDEAIEHYHLALALQPENLNTRCNLAAALAEGGGPRQAIAAYRQILELHPGHLVAHSNLLFNLSVDEQCSPGAYLAEAARFDSKLCREPLEPPPSASAAPGARLRIGFVSADLRTHPVGFFLEGIIHHLDPARVELFAYATIATEDALTERIRPRFTGWRMIKGQSDEAAARAIRADRIDILFDLAGHTGDNRLGVFAWRPAPVQVSWLGYFASTGVSAIDWVLADELCVPPGQDWRFTEKLWRLPLTRLCFTPPDDGTMPDVAPLPALRRGHVTFGCFQRLPKIGDAVLALWGQVFAALPEARLLLQSHQTGRPVYVAQILERLAAVGIAAERVTVRGPAHRSAYLESYGEVDIVLDTFPYTGGTTTCEALWMGVPTVTLAGDSMIARQGVSMLTSAGLPEWVAERPQDYVAKAVAFGSDVAALDLLRRSMRERVRGSALFDTRRFARLFEAAVDGLWRARSQADEAAPSSAVD